MKSINIIPFNEYFPSDKLPSSSPHCAILSLLSGGIQEGSAAASKGMESTKTMGSLAGRSNYVDETRMNGIPDPGAAVVAEAFAVALATLK